jgi:RecG-like helicase/REP element-mobilizing transposase RayT
MEISQPLLELDWIARPRVTALRRLGIEKVEDLLTHYPRRYEDRHEFPGFPHEESETPICLCGEVTNTRLLRFGGWKKIFEVTLQETNAGALSQPLTCRWFNLHYVQKMIATGQRLVVFGKPKLRGKRICIDHPEFEVIESDEEISIHFRRITPIYPATEGVSQRLLRSIIYRVLSELSDEPVETLAPARLVTGDRRAALQAIHFPENWEALQAARQHLVLSEFFGLQMLIASRRADSAGRTGGMHCGNGQLLDRFVKGLPFGLTNAQQKVIAEIRAGLVAKHPMNRLLQGDVGSGKTVVAIAAILLAVEAGFQAALMAPTQILAEQHYAVLRQWLEPLGIRLALRTAARQEDNAPLPLFENAAVQDPGSALVPSAGDAVPASRTLNGEDSARYAKRRLPHFEKPWAIYAVTMATKGRRGLSRASRTVVLDAIRHFDGDRYELFAACVMPDHVHLLIQPWVKAVGADDKSPRFWTLSELLRSIKSFSAHQINGLEGTKGSVWEKERFDRYVRGDRDLAEKFKYIVRNPWETGVVRPDEDYQWVWSGRSEDNQSSSHRDDATSTRDERATRSLPSDVPQIIIGTHALLYDSVVFENLGLVVIDEQHKFGVAQRARLTAREPAPDVLVMTATPIPRTLTMTVYGDLDVSIIDEMPANRGKIITAARDDKKLGEVLAFLRKQLESGRQAYVIYPLIEETEKLDAKAAAVEFERWKERLHPFTCELLHGRMAAAEKQETMERFRKGTTPVLISTTVIEVGVDVPNATVMLIENAERFGLAQLHQLRGRIGRGEHKSYCVLLSSDRTPETEAKLSVLEKTANGFEIAEADWEMRGPGDLLGTAQSGLPALKIGSLKSDADLMRRARASATLIFDKDPLLEWPENQRFRQLIVEEQGRTFANVS